MTVHDIYDLVDRIAPFRLQEEYDNAGLIVGAMNDPVHGILLCLDVTRETVSEADDRGADLILSHHPAIFKPIRRLDTVLQASVLAAIRHGFALLAAHTNFDTSPDGLNAFIVERMGLTDVRILQPRSVTCLYKVVTFVPSEFRDAVLEAMFAAGAGRAGSYSHASFHMSGTGGFLPEQGAHPFLGEPGRLSSVREDRIETIATEADLPAVLDALRRTHPYEEPAIDVFREHLPARETAGMGHAGNLPAPMSSTEFTAYAKAFFGVPVVGVIGRLPETVRRIALCSGAGSSVIPAVRPSGAEVLISGDITYHTALEVSQSGGCVMLVDHYSTERFFAPAMEEALRRSSPDTELPPLYQSAKEYQPLSYF